MSAPLALCYLLEDTPLFGGVKVILQQANLLSRRGHKVVVVSKGVRPSWFPLSTEFRQVPVFDAAHVPAADVTVASYWTTLEPAVALVADHRRGEVMHYCQGFEGIYTHNSDDHAAIRRAYQQPVPAMVVSPHLGELLDREFGRSARWIPQPLEPFWHPERPAWWPRWRPNKPARVLVTSPFEIDWKGVRTALEAVGVLRARGLEFQLVRLSQWPLSDAERAMVEPDEFHCHLVPEEAAAVVRSCDLLLAASWEQEGFGLGVLEAGVSGVPAVASDISAFRGFACGNAVLVPFDSSTAFADAAQEVLDQPRRWRSLRRGGLRLARQFNERASAEAAEAALRWAASGAWRSAARR